MEILKGVPVPVTNAGSKYPFRQMEVGDSFIVDPQQVLNVRTASYSYAKATVGVKFSTRRNPVDQLFYCWRIE